MSMSLVSSTSEHPSPRRKRRRLKSLAFLPTLITLGNLICGFAAIHFALRAMYDLGNNPPIEQLKILQRIELLLPSFLSIAAWSVLLGMILDCFDGLIARMTRSTTDFGGQLDSLADVVTCGVAPAIIMVAFMMQNVSVTAVVPSPISEHALGRFAWVSAAVYVACTAIRLARYNVEHEKADFDYKTFRGLPSPGAAGVMVTLIILQDWLKVRLAGEWITLVVIYAMPIIALGTAFLMVSRVPYRRFYRTYLLGRQPFGHVLIVLGVFVVYWLWNAPTLFGVMLWYALSGPGEYLYRFVQGRRTTVLQPADSQALESDRKLA